MRSRTAPDGCRCAFDAQDGIVRSINGPASDIFGVTAAEMANRSVLVLLVNVSPTALAELLSAVVKGAPQERSFEALHKSGAAIPVSMHLAHERGNVIIKARAAARVPVLHWEEPQEPPHLLPQGSRRRPLGFQGSTEELWSLLPPPSPCSPASSPPRGAPGRCWRVLLTHATAPSSALEGP